MSNTNTSASITINFSGLLTIAFIVLKLCKVITWSWIWVLSPLWLSAAVSIFIFLCIGLYYFVKYIRKARDEQARLKSGMNIWAWQRHKKNKKK